MALGKFNPTLRGSDNDVLDEDYSDADGGHDEARDVFGREEGHAIKYRTLSWQLVAGLMTAEIVGNGMLSLPFALAVVGIVPGIVLIAFLGVFATYTSWLLVKFKLRHPEVHNMGDAGYILLGPFGRELLSFGTVVFAIFATGSQLVVGQLALSVLSNNGLNCSLLYTGIFAVAILVLSFLRTFDRFSWLGVGSVTCIAVAAIVGMVGAGLHPAKDHQIQIVVPTTFYAGEANHTAFFAITNPVFAYAGHFMFFSLMSEMKHPQHAMRSAYVLQTTATSLYILFAAVTYVYLGPKVGSPSFVSLEPKWSKAAFGIALPNFLVGGALYSHTAAKVIFVRLFRGTTHIHEHTVLGWGTWALLVLLTKGAAFVLAVGVPIFNYLVGITASLFAAWYTYGIAGGFWLHDAWYSAYRKGGGPGGWYAYKKHMFQFILAVATVLAGAFICVAGLYVTIRGIIDAYRTGAITKPFAC